MRLALEDVLLLLKREFTIDTAPTWRSVIEEHLRSWREIQMMSAVRDAPEAAAEVLRLLGYTVEPPTVPPPRVPLDQIKLYWQ
ncbi:hypothetical protein ACFXI6_12180 [Streptomyces mirabilis]|uniref:hypothetical protein n=1 Tax=Streptomyces mirabilis TaxID=68239 RepID=UPI0036C122F3